MPPGRRMAAAPQDGLCTRACAPRGPPGARHVSAKTLPRRPPLRAGHRPGSVLAEGPGAAAACPCRAGDRDEAGSWTAAPGATHSGDLGCPFTGLCGLRGLPGEPCAPRPPPGTLALVDRPRPAPAGSHGHLLCGARCRRGGGRCPAAPGPHGATGPDQPLPPGRRGSGEGAKPRQAPALTPQHLTRKPGERARPYWATSSSSDPSRSREDTAPSACAPLFLPAHTLRAQGPPRPTSRPGWAPAGRHGRPLHQTGAAEAGTVGGEPSGRQGPGKAPTPAHRRRGQAARAEGARRGPRRGAHGLCGLSSGRRVGHHPCPLPSPLAPRDCPGPSPPADPAGR